MLQINPLFPQSEQTFLVIEASPYLGYERVFSGSATECLSWCKEHGRSSVNELYKLFKIQDDLLVIIVSTLLVDTARTSHLKKLLNEDT